jgi:hypothetical protein
MSLQTHLAELEKRHQAIEKEISDQLHHSSSSDLHIVELKRKKLKLKEEIVRLQSGAPSQGLH